VIHDRTSLLLGYPKKIQGQTQFARRLMKRDRYYTNKIDGYMDHTIK
jgi:hypothetical protein